MTTIDRTKFLSKPIVTDPEGNTLTGEVFTFTETPQSRNAFRFMPRVTPPSDRNSLKEGSMYFDDGGKQFYYYDGSSWLPLIQPVSGTPLYSPSISNRIARFNGTAGAIKDSLVSLDDLGNIAGVNNLTTTGAFSATTASLTTSLSTPSITTAGTGINFNSKNITSAGTVGGTDATFSSSVTTPVLSSTGTDINVSAKNLTNVAAVTGTTGTFSTSLSTPSITTSGTTIGFNSKNVSGIGTLSAGAPTFSGALTGTTGNFTSSMQTPTMTLSTSLSTPSITSPTFQIGFNSKEINTIQNVSSDQYSSGPSAGDLKFLSATTFADFTSAANLKNLDTIAYSGTNATMTGIKAITNASSTLALNGVQSITATSGDMTITAAPASLLKLSGSVFLDTSLTLTAGGISTPTITATTQVATNTITTNGGASISFNSKDVTSVGNLQALKNYSKVGTSYYPCAICIYSIRSQTGQPLGTQTWVNPTWASGSFANNGDSLAFSIVGAVANTGNTKQVQVVVNTLNLGALTLAGNGVTTNDWRIDGELWRASATTVDWNYRVTQSTGTGTTYSDAKQGRGQTVSSFATNSLSISIQSLTAATNDITFNTARITYNPAA